MDSSVRNSGTILCTVVNQRCQRLTFQLNAHSRRHKTLQLQHSALGLPRHITPASITTMRFLEALGHLLLLPSRSGLHAVHALLPFSTALIRHN